MTDYYIAKDGVDDVDRGTAESPAATLRYVIDTLGASQGDTVYFFAGTYTTEIEFSNNTDAICYMVYANFVSLQKAPNETGEVIFKPSAATSSLGGDYKKTLIEWTGFNALQSDFIALKGITITYTESQAQTNYEPLIFEQSGSDAVGRIILEDNVFDWDFPDSDELTFTNLYGLNFISPAKEILLANNTFYHKNKNIIRVRTSKGLIKIKGNKFITDFAPASAGALEDEDSLGKVFIDNAGLSNSDGSLEFVDNDVSYTHGDYIAAANTNYNFLYIHYFPNFKVLNNNFSIKQHDDVNNEGCRWNAIFVRQSTLQDIAIISGNSFHLQTRRSCAINVSASSSLLQPTLETLIENNNFNADDESSATSDSRFIQADYSLLNIRNNVFNNGITGMRLYATPAGSLINNNRFLNIRDSSQNASHFIKLDNAPHTQIENNEFVFSGATAEGSTVVTLSRVDTRTSDGLIIQNNNFVINDLLFTNKTRMFNLGIGTGIQKESGDDDAGRSSWIRDNVYSNADLINNVSIFATVAYESDSTVTAADWKTNFEPSANYNPSFLTKSLIKPAMKSYNTHRMIGYRKDFQRLNFPSEEILLNGYFRSSIRNAEKLFDGSTQDWVSGSNSTLSYDETNEGLKITNTTAYGKAYQNVQLVEGGRYRLRAVLEESQPSNARIFVGSSAGSDDMYGSLGFFAKGLIDIEFKATQANAYVILITNHFGAGSSTTWSYVSLRRIG